MCGRAAADIGGRGEAGRIRCRLGAWNLDRNSAERSRRSAKKVARREGANGRLAHVEIPKLGRPHLSRRVRRSRAAMGGQEEGREASRSLSSAVCWQTRRVKTGCVRRSCLEWGGWSPPSRRRIPSGARKAAKILLLTGSVCVLSGARDGWLGLSSKGESSASGSRGRGDARAVRLRVCSGVHVRVGAVVVVRAAAFCELFLRRRRGSGKLFGGGGGEGGEEKRGRQEHTRKGCGDCQFKRTLWGGKRRGADLAATPALPSALIGRRPWPWRRAPPPTPPLRRGSSWQIWRWTVGGEACLLGLAALRARGTEHAKCRKISGGPQSRAGRTGGRTRFAGQRSRSIEG